MAPQTPATSKRLLKAAQAEAAELARHRDKLLSSRDRLRDELDRLEKALDDVAERQALIERIAGVPSPPEKHANVELVAGPEVAGLVSPQADDATVLAGPDIRRIAVEVLLALPGRPEALHYREWYEAIIGAGYRIAGKDPLAVFLTQLSRSPAVQKGSQSGVYELDRNARARLRYRLDDMQRELRDLAADTGSHDRVAVRKRRSEVASELARAERALEEVEGVFAATAQGAHGG